MVAKQGPQDPQKLSSLKSPKIPTPLKKTEMCHETLRNGRYGTFQKRSFSARSVRF